MAASSRSAVVESPMTDWTWGIVDLESSDDAVSVRRCRDRHSAVEQQRRAERVDGVNNSVDDAGLNQLLGCESCDLPGHSVGRCGRAGHHDVTAHLDDSDPPRRRGSVGVRSDDQRIMRRESLGASVRLRHRARTRSASGGSTVMSMFATRPRCLRFVARDRATRARWRRCRAGANATPMRTRR